MKKITLKENNTFAHWVISGHPQPPGKLVEVSDAVAMELSQNRQSKKYDVGIKSTINYVPDFVIADAKAAKLSDINTRSTDALSAITTLYTRSEIDSWSTQEAEAVAWNADNTEQTPLIDAIVANRHSVDKATLVSRILTNAADYKALSGVVIGKRQAFEDELNALSDVATQAEVDAIVVTF